MPHVSANGITLCYQASGERGATPLLLIMGLGGQLTAWDDDLVTALASRGFFVVLFDNRDVGRSTWFDETGPPDVFGAFNGGGRAPYLLADMADDAVGLLDSLELPAAHVLGVSMGGMIAQTLAIDHPDRVLSLVSIMSTTGDSTVGAPHPEAIAALLRPPPTDREGAMIGAVEVWKAIGSPGFPFHEDRIRAEAGAAYDRAFHPAGTGRQLVAILSSPDRTNGLRGLSCPSLVVHGDADPLVDPSGGRATAAAVPGADLMIVAGMGHHLPPEIFADLADRVAALQSTTAC
ncbi:MAG: alpha/beta fold hydrolase [Actinomycetota bacterium]|nr:alpha/beta fold hydrolase [Actinomycetota bacterium]